MKRLLCLGLCLILLTGCSANSKNPYVPTGNGLTPDTPAEPQGSGITEQVMSLAYYPDRSLSPYQSTDTTNRTLFSLIYQSLFSVDENYIANPILCKNYTVSRDMKTYTFYLENASFSDGQPVTAADVVASLKTASTSAYYGGRFAYVESFSVTDDEAVEIQLSTPYEDLPILLDVPIVPKKQVGQERPLGSGPYIYEEFDGALRLRRRTDWWCKALLPVTAQIISLVVGESPSQLRDSFEFSGLGMVVTDPGTESYVDFHSDYELWDCETGIFVYLACNKKSPLFKDEDFRRMLTYAVDRDHLAETYYRGFADSAYLPASPRSPYYSTALIKDMGYAPEKFADALSAVEAEKTIVLLVNKDDGVRLRVARYIANGLTQCGLKVTMSELATAKYVSALENGEYDLYLGQTKLSANMDLTAFYQKGGALSFGGMNNSMLNTLCKESLANSGNYTTLYKQVLEDGMLCPLLFRSNAIFVQRGTFTELYSSRDNVFYYDLGKDPSAAKTIP